MNLKKVWLIFLPLPLAAGGVFAFFVLPKNGPSQEFSGEAVKTNAVPFEKIAPKTISSYLLSSQTLFSKAIEVSLNQADAQETVKIVDLINEAISMATKAIIHYPTDPRGYAQRAKIYEAIEKYSPESSLMALKDWERAAILASNDPQYYLKASQLAEKKDKPLESLDYLRKAQAIAPTEAQILFDLAKKETRLGLLIDAKATYEKLLALLVDQKQKETVSKELSAIEELLAQNNTQPNYALEENKIEFPDNPLQLEADGGSRVVIADPGEEKDESIESQASSNALSGTAILKGGDKEIEISNNNITTQSQIYLTAIGETEGRVLRVKNKKAFSQDQQGSFTVSINGLLNHDLEFKWWIINP